MRNRLPARIGVVGGGREGEGLGLELIPKLFPIPFELIPKPYLGCLAKETPSWELGLWAGEGFPGYGRVRVENNFRKILK